MKFIFLCKSQKPSLECKSRLKFEGMQGDFYFCGSHKKVNECWGNK